MRLAMPLTPALSRLALCRLLAATSLAWLGWMSPSTAQTTVVQTPAPVAANAPAQIKTQVPGYYRMGLGDFTVTALYDGFIDLDTKLLKNASEREIQRLVTRMFQQLPKVQTAVNAYLINTGTNLVLVDAGTAKAFGPSLGFIMDNIRAAGYQPEQVDTVLLTHMHADHINGLLTADGKIAFPNARVYTHKKEADFWLSEANTKAAKKEDQPFFMMAQAAAKPYITSGQWRTFEADGPIVPGVEVVALPGHTPGHAGFVVSSKGQKLLIWGDVIHAYAVQFSKPEVSIEFDVDAKAAIATRKALLKRVAAEKLWVAGMHMPFPGIGHVRADGKTYTWVPIEFGPVR